MKDKGMRLCRSFMSALLIMFLLSACSKRWDWVPEQTHSFNYIKLEEHPGPFCFSVCSYFTAYLFENGDLVYYGGPGNAKSGWGEMKLESIIYNRALSLFEKYEFSKFSTEYRYEEAVCGNDYLTDQDEIWILLATKSLNKRVVFDFGCGFAPDRDRVMRLWVEMKMLLPLEAWVGAKRYAWDYERYPDLTKKIFSGSHK